MKTNTAKESRTILLVDDDEDFLLGNQVRFTQAGYRVVTANSCAEARQVIESQNFDAAVVDLMMENMDSGIVLAHHLKKKNPKLPVLIVTAMTRDTGMVFGETEGISQWVKADKVLPKPVRFEQVASEIEKLLAAAKGK